MDGDLQLNLQRSRVAEMRELGPVYVISPRAWSLSPQAVIVVFTTYLPPPNQFVNDYIPVRYRHLKYALFNEALDQVRIAGQGARMIKRDLADAFRHIPIHPSDWWLFGFEWRGRLFQE